jgi:hypothetical protein
MNYLGFWRNFEECVELRELFEYIFSDIKQQITITSVFGYVPGNLPGIVAHFSGETLVNLLPPPGVNLVMCSLVAKNIIPMHLFSIEAYKNNSWGLLSIPRVLPEQKKFCAFVVSNTTGTVRNLFMELLSKYRKVDCAGNYKNNINKNAPRDTNEYMQFLSEYKFNICFEHSNTTNYITEKLFNAYLGGGIPIYWGTSQVLEWFNPRAFLYLPDNSEKSMEILINKIIQLDQNPEMYKAMQSEPLLLGDIPECMKKETWKKRINDIYLCEKQ